MEDFVWYRYDIPLTLPKKKSLEDKELPKSLNFSVIKSRKCENPQLVVFMFHGWTSNKESMLEQTRNIIAEMFQHKESDLEEWHDIMFVQLNAPYLLKKEEEMTTLDDDDNNDDEQRFWWVIDGPEIFQKFLDDQLESIFDDPGEGLGISVKYSLAILEIVKTMTPNAGFVFMGFSQGGGIALNVAVAAIDDYPVCGLIICSGLLNNANSIEENFNMRFVNLRVAQTLDKKDTKWEKDIDSSERFAKFLSMPVLHSHGTKDATIFYEIGERFHSFLENVMKMQNSCHHPFEGAHEITNSVRRHIVSHLIKIFEFKKIKMLLK